MLFGLFSSKKEEKSESDTILVIGLGNPGEKYSRNRHNVGFMVVDEVRDDLNASPWRKEHNYLISEGRRDDKKVILLKPQTYMNKSGEALAIFLRYHSEPKKVIVVQDDMDLSLGTVRVQQNGGSGGHNGVESVRNHYSNEITRIKIGLVSEETERFRKENPSDFVLGNFLESEQGKVKEVLQEAKEKVKDSL